MKGINTNTVQFVRWLATDPILWDELTKLLRNKDISDRLYDEWYEETDRTLENVYQTEANLTFDLDFLCEVDLDQVMALITHGCVCIDTTTSRHVCLAEVLDPKVSSQPESKAYGIYSWKKINGKYGQRITENFGGNVGPVVEPDLGKDEVQQVLNECKDVREGAL
jgi:hypothetical protein